MKIQKNRRHQRAEAVILAAFVLCIYCFVPICAAQAPNWPDKISGYKVHSANVTVSSSANQKVISPNTDVFVKFTDPTIAEIKFTSAVVEIGAEITSLKQDGKIEFVTFHGVMVNGIAVDVNDYKHSFSLSRGKPAILPKPARVLLRLTSLPRAIYSEIFERKDDLAVTGTAFVFGRFKKFGFGFKRVIPIGIDLRLRNPLRP